MPARTRRRQRCQPSPGVPRGGRAALSRRGPATGKHAYRKNSTPIDHPGALWPKTTSLCQGWTTRACRDVAREQRRECGPGKGEEVQRVDPSKTGRRRTTTSPGRSGARAVSVGIVPGQHAPGEHEEQRHAVVPGQHELWTRASANAGAAACEQETAVAANDRIPVSASTRSASMPRVSTARSVAAITRDRWRVR